jgi:hypothetical protein
MVLLHGSGWTGEGCGGASRSSCVASGANDVVAVTRASNNRDEGGRGGSGGAAGEKRCGEAGRAKGVHDKRPK